MGNNGNETRNEEPSREEPLYIELLVSGKQQVTLRDLLKAWWLDTEFLPIFLTGLICFGTVVQPDQGAVEEETYKGQPVVWDGFWDWRSTEEGSEWPSGQMWFVGSDGPGGGSGKEVERQVMLDDRVLFI